MSFLSVQQCIILLVLINPASAVHQVALAHDYSVVIQQGEPFEVRIPIRRDLDPIWTRAVLFLRADCLSRRVIYPHVTFRLGGHNEAVLAIDTGANDVFRSVRHARLNSLSYILAIDISDICEAINTDLESSWMDMKIDVSSSGSIELHPFYSYIGVNAIDMDTYRPGCDRNRQ